MRKKLLAGLAIGLFVIGMTKMANALLITNGSFEVGDFIANTNGDMSLSVGLTNIEGWTVINDEIAWEKNGNVWGLIASDGLFFLDLTGYQNPSPYGGVSQTIATTIGQQYTLSFDLGTNQSNPYLTGPISVMASAGSTSQSFIFDPSGSGNQWQTFSMDFIADSASMPISFIGTGGINFIGLDNVSVAPVAPVPEANAGVDQAVNEGNTVVLDGSGSSDTDGDPLTYQWLQIAGIPVSLNLIDPVHPTFVAPSVPVGGATLTFQLTVSDGQLTSSPDIVNISVKNVNHAPIPNAGNDQTVAEGASVQLDGSGSYDPDGEDMIYHWSQTAGPLVQLSNAGAVKPSFTAPLVGIAGATLTFELSVSDGVDGAVDVVNVIVENVNHAPVADAGVDQTRNEGSVIMLDGTASSDPDSDVLSFNWTQVSGQPVILSDSHSPNPAFTAPLVASGGETLIFQLVVNDGLADSMPDQVTINILNVNDPPACELAKAVPALLWPPNHKMVSVNISGITDPNNDNVAVKVTNVTQDEPINGLGDGDTSPDAVIQGEGVLLRAERSGNGNGRVYQVYFSADDGQGGICSGSVKVSVPHSKNQGDSVVDDGQLYNSYNP